MSNNVITGKDSTGDTGEVGRVGKALQVGAAPLSNYNTTNRLQILVQNLSPNRTSVFDTDLDHEMVYIGDGTTNVAADWRYAQRVSVDGFAHVENSRPIKALISNLAYDATVGGSTVSLSTAGTYKKLRIYLPTDAYLRFSTTVSSADGAYMATGTHYIPVPASATSLALIRVVSNGTANIWSVGL